MTPPVHQGQPGSVLFACTLNSVRSPMAEAIARHYFGNRIYFDSAGVEPQPLDPMAIAVMDEVGLCLRDHEARSFNALTDTSFDLVVTFSEEAYAEAKRICRTSAVDVELWPIENPGGSEGSREARLCLMRHIRDRLMLRIRDRFGTVSEKIGA
jgi:protein-tyrosine-phosphatase